MADSFRFDLVSPERRLASLAATAVQIPGVAGDFTAMPNHAPFLTTLRPGIIRVRGQGGDQGGDQEFLVTGGFAEISPTQATVLAERAVPRAEASADLMAEVQTEAETAAAEAPDEAKIAAAQRLNDVRTLRAQLGL